MLPRLTLILALACSTAARADDSFTKSLSPEDFQAAGLGKLTPDELARLDALIQGEKTGAVAKAKEETTQVVTEQVRKQVTEQVRQQVKAEDFTEAQKKPGIVDRLKVVLRPGTVVEYTTLDATIAPPFKGWQKGTILTLTNGQRWVVTDGDQYWAPKTYTPVRVHIVPGVLGSFFMEIENGGRPRVKFLDDASASP
jgi:hypothetical protein